MEAFLQSEEGSETTSTHEEEEEVNDFGIGTLVLAMALGTVSRIYITHLTGLPYTVVVLILGLAFGIVLHEEVLGHLSLLGDSLEKWTNLSPDVILFVFLPILIFESAFNTDVHIFQREFWQVLTLAGPGVVIATVLTACVVQYVFPYDWDWNTALMLGGMLSATDPVAVVALLKELGVSERLAVLIEGESLLNDAVAIVVFIVFRDALVGYRDSSPLSVLETAARMSLGGPVVGMVLGMLGSFSLGYIIDDEMTEITLTVIVCFSAFMISEATELEVSGVLAVVTTGLVMSFYARGRISPGVEKSMHNFWSMLTYVANTVIFFVSGLIIGDRALFDENIEARDWGLLGLLYLALQAIRFLVVLALLPVLTRGGYGMNYRQIAVLAFAGLRGAVGLTLGLIVVEDERIEEDTRSLVLFYIAGIAAMTLVINGSLTGPLVHYLGLDRSTTAETEVFVRACSAIEARLEHKLDLLKGDRFLGDADWEMVWRYIPVSTAKSYWHRIRHGNINLSEMEETDIHDILHRRSRRTSSSGTTINWSINSLQGSVVFGQGGCCGGLRDRAAFAMRRVRKWLTRRVFQLPGGGGYDDLPPRLRQTWYGYHKNFHFSYPAASGRGGAGGGGGGGGGADISVSASIRSVPSALEAERHRRDMELHRLNAEPRMMVEAEAWVNLNEGGGADMISSTQTPVSSTLRKHLDNVGIMGFKESVGMMSGLGQAEMEQQATGARPGSLLDGQRDEGAMVPKRARGGSGGGKKGTSALRAVEGLKKLKEDRRTAAQAVAKAEARLARLKKDMGIILHKGEEQEMADSIQQTRGMKGPSRRSSTSNGMRSSSSTNALDDALSSYHRRASGVARRTVTGSHGIRGSASDEGFAVNIHGRGQGDNNDEKKPAARQWQQQQQQQEELSSPVPPPGSPVWSDVGLPLDDTGDKGMFGDLIPALADDSTSGGGKGDAGGGNRGAVSTSVVAAREWEGEGGERGGQGRQPPASDGAAEAGMNPLDEDSDDDDEEEGGRAALTGTPWGGDVTSTNSRSITARARRRGSRLQQARQARQAQKDSSIAFAGISQRGLDERTGGVIAPGTVTMGSMAEARVRFLTAVKAHFTERYCHGWLSSTGLRVLKENMDAQLDYEERELDQWGRLSGAFKLPRRMGFMRKVPLVGSLVESYMYQRLTFIFELASNFISAHEDVDILELLNEGPVAYQLALEKNRQLQEARATLSQQLPVFPELARSLKTQVATRYMLLQHREVAHELFRQGHINEREFEGLITQNNTARVRLDYHPQADQIPDRVTLLKNVPFLRFLTDEEKEIIIKDEKACQEEFYGSNVVLMKEKTSSAKGHRRAGWFSVVRGAVRQTTEGVLDHTSVGGTIRRRRLAKERLVNAGTVIGLDEQLMDAPYQCTYVTSSFVHLFFFDKNQMLTLAEQHPGLKRGLWWLLAVSVVRHHHGFRRMNLMGVYQLMRTAEFRELKTRTVAQVDSRHSGRRTILKMSPPMPSSLNVSRHDRPSSRNDKLLSRNDKLLSRNDKQLSRRDRPSGRFDKPSAVSPPRRRAAEAPAFIRAAASLNESRHRLSMNIRRSGNASRGQLSVGGDQASEGLLGLDSPEFVRYKIFLEEGSSVLLLKGVMMRREKTTLFEELKEQRAVTIIRDVHGPVEFSDGSVMFVMPAILLARSASSHQLLMREIEDRYNAMAEAAAAEAEDPLPAEAPTLAALSSTSGRWRMDQPLSASGRPRSVTSPRTPSRLNLGMLKGARVPAREQGELGQVTSDLSSLRNALATDAVTIAAVDEANPMAHPDTLRRRRTLRDAGLAAKAALSTSGSFRSVPSGGGSSSSRSIGGGILGKEALVRSLSGSSFSRSGRISGTAVAPGDEGEGEDGGGLESGGPSRQRSGHSLARIAGGTSRQNSFVEMVDVPVVNMDEDSSRSSRATTQALLYPEPYRPDPTVHAI